MRVLLVRLGFPAPQPLRRPGTGGHCLAMWAGCMSCCMCDTRRLRVRAGDLHPSTISTASVWSLRRFGFTSSPVSRRRAIACACDACVLCARCERGSKGNSGGLFLFAIRASMSPSEMPPTETLAKCSSCSRRPLRRRRSSSVAILSEFVRGSKRLASSRRAPSRSAASRLRLS